MRGRFRNQPLLGVKPKGVFRVKSQNTTENRAPSTKALPVAKVAPGLITY
jgi:hypothetical protein